MHFAVKKSANSPNSAIFEYSTESAHFQDLIGLPAWIVKPSTTIPDKGKIRYDADCDSMLINLGYLKKQKSFLFA